MKYKGIELQEFKSDKPIVFDPPKKMLVWDDCDDGDIETASRLMVYAYLPARPTNKVVADIGNWPHCAEITEITEEPKHRRATAGDRPMHNG